MQRMFFSFSTIATAFSVAAIAAATLEALPAAGAEQFEFFEI